MCFQRGRSWKRGIVKPQDLTLLGPLTLEKAVAHRAIGAGLLFPWNRAYAGNGFGFFGDLNEVMRYIRKKGGEGVKGK